MLTPLDLNNKNFSKGFRGYDTEEVDEFFAKVAKDFERLYQDNVELMTLTFSSFCNRSASVISVSETGAEPICVRLFIM